MCRFLSLANHYIFVIPSIRVEFMNKVNGIPLIKSAQFVLFLVFFYKKCYFYTQYNMTANMTIKKKDIPKPTYFGKNLKFLRRHKGLTQTELAKNIGLNRNNIASYESSVVEPNVNNFLKIVKYLNVNPHDMLDTILENKVVVSVDSANTNDLNELEIYLKEQLELFSSKTNEINSVLVGFRLAASLKEKTDKPKPNKELASSMSDFMEVLDLLIESNWDYIRSIYNEEK